MTAAATAEPMRRRALRWGAHLTGLLLLGWFLRGVSWGELGLALRQTSGRALVGVMAMAFGSTALQGLRFWVLCPAGLSLRKHIQLSFALLHGGFFFLQSADLLLELCGLFAVQIFGKFLRMLSGFHRHPA